MRKTSLLNQTIDALGLDPKLAARYRRPCAARLGAFRRRGDCPDEGLMIGFAIAQHEVPQGPGWIPEVQRRAVEYSAIADRLAAQADPAIAAQLAQDEIDRADRLFDGGEWSGPAQDRRDEER